MSSRTSGAISVVVAVAAALVLVATTAAMGGPPSASSSPSKLPRLVDVGARHCAPCMAMAPILENLKSEYAGRMEVELIDMSRDLETAKPFAVRVIPTQIFFGSDGKELARHEGFMAKDEILAKWKALGVGL